MKPQSVTTLIGRKIVDVRKLTTLNGSKEVLILDDGTALEFVSFGTLQSDRTVSGAATLSKEVIQTVPRSEKKIEPVSVPMPLPNPEEPTARVSSNPLNNPIAPDDFNLLKKD